MQITDLFESSVIRITETDILGNISVSGVNTSMWSKNGLIHLSSIIVDSDKRNNGLGTEFMNLLCSHADNTQQQIVLTPDTVYGASSVNRLKKFYKQFGFVENKGRNKDYAFTELMYRNPRI